MDDSAVAGTTYLFWKHRPFLELFLQFVWKTPIGPVRVQPVLFDPIFLAFRFRVVVVIR